VEWTFAACACCNCDVLVPRDVAVRVWNGDSHIVCDECLQHAATAEDVDG
jgi:hypothetical protein